MLQPDDLKDLAFKGISPSAIEEQLERFRKGFPYLRISDVATVENHGILRLDLTQEKYYEAEWEDFLSRGGEVEKFVPASGAASRMFKNLFAFVSAGQEAPSDDFMKSFFEGIERFAFFPALDAACRKCYGQGVREMLADGCYINVVKCLISDEGLNYGAMPKGLLQFHRHGEEVHTPLEEHLEEGAQYAADKEGKVNIHFTVSPEHRSAFEAMLAEKVSALEEQWGVSFHVTLSEQKPSTDTLAVTLDNQPYRENGHLVFRPAGHGALIENLNEMDADVVFIKNIDNVVPTSLRETTVRYKKIIGGCLVKLQRQIASYIQQLRSGRYTSSDLQEMLSYLHDTLNVRHESVGVEDTTVLAEYLLSKFNRPLRVCGVVKNDGEPGGGPYITYNADNTTSPQILEAAQIDPTDTAMTALAKSGSHFNPVDLVCYIKDVDGKKFDLKRFVDKDTGLISEKSKSGVTVKALELPGLWNGSMSDWNTIFLEVPLETFNPVKTVNDLLRPQHQG